MQSVFLSIVYSNDSQQAFHIFYWSCVKVNTQMSHVKNVIHGGSTAVL